MLPWRTTKRDAPPADPLEGRRRYVFVSGHPRSGTNWVSSLLNLHPDCFCDGEFHFLILRWAMDGFTSLPWYLGALEPQRSTAERAFQRLIRECLFERAKERLLPLGRTPPAVLGDHTPRLFRVMINPPEARYLVIQRDGRDVLVSYTFHLLNTKSAEVIPEHIRGFYTQQLATLDGTQERQRAAGVALLNHEPWVRYYANFWSDHVLHDARIARGVESQGFGPYVKFLRYESLRADVERGRREIYEHLGLDPSRAAPVSPETNTAPGFGGREDVTSFYRKGESGDWRRYFTPEIARWFHETAGAAMASAGYEPGGDWVQTVRTPGDPGAGAPPAGTPLANTHPSTIPAPGASPAPAGPPEGIGTVHVSPAAGHPLAQSTPV
jgi:hypothetical protein